MTTATKTPMTAGEAKSFRKESINSYSQIVEQLIAKGDHVCEPYRDTFTFKRWLAQGFAVQKGEHGIKFQTFVPADGKADENGDREPFLLPRTLVVFCRHQVAPVVVKS